VDVKMAQPHPAAEDLFASAWSACYLGAIARGKAKGADSVILGCTEICLLVGPEHIDLPVFDSTLLHADAAIEFSMTQPAPHPRAA